MISNRPPIIEANFMHWIQFVFFGDAPCMDGIRQFRKSLIFSFLSFIPWLEFWGADLQNEKFVWVLQDPFGTNYFVESGMSFPSTSQAGRFIDPSLVHIVVIVLGSPTLKLSLCRALLNSQ